MADLKTDLISLSDYVFERTRNRLTGLTDAEYFWQPAPDCWTLRPTESGEYRADRTDSPGTQPFTTIAWRLWHLIECYGGKRNPQWLGVDREPGGFDRDDAAPSNAAEAISTLDRANAFWRGVLEDLPADKWSQPFGAAAGRYADTDKASLVLHQLDEQIHHGAEIGVLRDLYRQRSATVN